MIPIAVTVGPLASASANNISTSQTAPGAFNLAINGALASGNSATNIAAAQAVASATTLTLNGSLVTSGIAYLAKTTLAGQRIVITSSGDDSGITFTVSGIGTDGHSYESEVITGSNTSVVGSTKLFTQITSVTTSGAAAANVSVGTNGIATLDKPRRVLFTSAGDDHTRTATITGTDWNGAPQTETLTLANATTAYTLIDFATVSSINLSGATASTITVGTNGIASSRPLLSDTWSFAPISLQVTATGTVNYTVQQSNDDPNDSAINGIPGMTWVSSGDSAAVGATATVFSNFTYVPRCIRVLLNSGSGTIKMTVMQAASRTAV